MQIASEAVITLGLRGRRCGRAGYVEQFDTLLAELTVREMLLYTAELKCSLSESLAKKKRRVDSLLETLALERCSNTLIGDALARGISGGQVSAPVAFRIMLWPCDAPCQSAYNRGLRRGGVTESCSPWHSNQLSCCVCTSGFGCSTYEANNGAA